MPSPPLAPPGLSRNGEGLRAGCGLFRCRRLACFPMPLPRLGRFGPLPSLPVISCGLAASHMPTEDALDAVRSLRLLPRWSVLIVFKMLPYQSFKTLRLFGMALLYGYRGGVSNPVASSFHPPFRLGGLGLIACVPCVAACQSLTPLSVSRFSLPSPPVRYDRQGGGYGLLCCLPDGASNVACGLIAAVMRSFRCLPHAFL